MGTLGAPATLAQSVHYSRVEAVSGVGVQLQFHATVKKDCTLLPPPSVRVLEVPKSGTLTLRKGVATINSVAGCQAIKAPAEAVLYQSQAAFVGTDHIRYEVTSANGDVDVYDITVDVKATQAAPQDAPPKSGASPT